MGLIIILKHKKKVPIRIKNRKKNIFPFVVPSMGEFITIDGSRIINATISTVNRCTTVCFIYDSVIFKVVF